MVWVRVMFGVAILISSAWLLLMHVFAGIFVLLSPIQDGDFSGLLLGMIFVALPTAWVALLIFAFLRLKQRWIRVVITIVAWLPILLSPIEDMRSEYFPNSQTDATLFGTWRQRQMEVAIKQHQVGRVRNLLPKINVKEATEGGTTMLGLAIRHVDSDWRSHDILRELLQAGADPNLKQPDYPMKEAIQNSKFTGPTPFRILLEYGGRLDIIPTGAEDPLLFELASNSTHSDLMRIALDHGVDLNMRSKKGRTLLAQAVLHDNQELVQKLLQAGYVEEGIIVSNGKTVEIYWRPLPSGGFMREERELPSVDVRGNRQSARP